MTVEEASKLNCPYKPYKTTLEGESVPTCQPVGCMCWIEVIKKEYTDKLVLRDSEELDAKKHPNHRMCSSHYYDTSYYIQYGIPTTTEHSYCSLRGKDV